MHAGRVLAHLLVGLSCAGGVAHSAPPEAVLLNPFGDPFVQATQGRACPAPLGPAYTEGERRQEAHSRIERGTSCWLAGKCKEPNSYHYDAPIARAVVAALRADKALADTALWVIAERRFVYLQGCVATQAQADRAEALAKAVPDVQYVLPKLTRPGERPRYRLAPAPRRGPPSTTPVRSAPSISPASALAPASPAASAAAGAARAASR